MKKNNLMPIIFIILASMFYYGLYWNKLFIYARDYGFYLTGGVRVCNAQLPNIDFYSYYPPLRYLLLGGWFKIFGISIASERILAVLLLTVANILFFLVSVRFLPKLLALVPTLIHLVIPGSWWQIWYIIAVLLGLLLIFKYLEKPSMANVFILGLGASFLAWIRQDIVVYVTVASLSIIFLNSPRGLLIKTILYFILGLVSGGTSLIFYYLLGGVSPRLFYEQSIWLTKLVMVASSYVPKTSIFPDTIFAIIEIIALIIFAIFVYRNKDNKQTSIFNYALIIMAAFCFIHMLVGLSGWYRFPEDQGLMYIVITILWLYAFRYFINNRLILFKGFIALFALLVIISAIYYYVFYTLKYEPIYGGSYPQDKKFKYMSLGRLGNIKVSTNFSRLGFKELVDFINVETKKDEYVFYGSDAFLAFLSGHPSPAREDTMFYPFAYKKRMQELIGEMNKNTPVLIILSKRDINISLRYPIDNILSFIDFIKKRYIFLRSMNGYYIFKEGVNKGSDPNTIKVLGELFLNRLK